jgi:hypothetical protein
MKILLAVTLIGLATLMSATSAAAYVVAVPASFPVDAIDDDAELDAAIDSAVHDVLKHAIAFSPTFVTVQTARVVGDRVYILLLIGDGEGEALLKTMSDGAEKTVGR